MYPAGRSSPKTYQTRRAWASFVRTTEVVRLGTTTWTWLHTPREKATLEFRRNRMRILLPSAGGRKPLLLLRFAGAFLLRFAERTFAGSLLNVPPRRIRGFGRRPLKGHSTKQ